MRIVIVSNIRCLREAIQAGLTGRGFQGQSEALSLPEFDRASFEVPPDLVLVSCPAAEGIALLGGFRSAWPSSPVAVLASSDGHDDFFAWARFGISGYIEPDAALDDVASIALRLAIGEIVYPARLSGALLNQFARQSGPSAEQSMVGLLTRRELTVLELLSDGLSNKQIARRLAIADATVKNHVHSVLEKMAVERRGEAAAFYRRLPAREDLRIDRDRDARAAGRVARPEPAAVADRLSLPTHAALRSGGQADGGAGAKAHAIR